MAPRLVAGFEHRAGLHCGSTAMADALRHVGVSLTEEMAFGLGAGPSFLLFEGMSGSPSRFFLGRSAPFEAELCRNLGVAFDETSLPYEHAWREIRLRIEANRAVLALTDLRWLPHYETMTHFNGHRIVIAGYDDETNAGLIADSHFPGILEVPSPAMREALVSGAPPLVKADVIFGSLEAPRAPIDLPSAITRAVAMAADEMLQPGGFAGVSGVERLARKLPSWRDAEDASFCARFAYQVIEKRGCGGGLFRSMYARFLDEASVVADDAKYVGLSLLARESAEAWTAFAMELRSVSESPSAEFSRASELAADVATKERRLWEAARDA